MTVAKEAADVGASLDLAVEANEEDSMSNVAGKNFSIVRPARHAFMHDFMSAPWV